RSERKSTAQTGPLRRAGHASRILLTGANLPRRMRENRIADSSQKLYRYATFSKRCCVSRKKKKGFETCQRQLWFKGKCMDRRQKHGRKGSDVCLCTPPAQEED